MMSKSVGLDAQIAERIVGTTMCRLRPTPVNKILCTKAALKEDIRAAAEEAHEIGFLAGQKEQYAELTRPGSSDRPAWMDIRLDDSDDLAKNHIRFQPVVLRSLLGAGYCALAICAGCQAANS